MVIEQLFELLVAKSKSTDDYSSGEIPFVTNTELNNGVVKYVEPFYDDVIFEGPAICISGLGYATIHFDRFLPKGNGGDSCTVLIPKKEMSSLELLYYATLFNTLHCWRFSYGRKTSRSRISNLVLSPLYCEAPIDIKAAIDKNFNEMQKLLRKEKKKF